MTRRGPLALLAAALLLFAVALGSGCGTASTASSGALDVVASTSFLADIAQNVAGDRFRCGSLVPRGTDPHAFEPAPSDLREVAGADLVIINGGGLEGTLLTTLENAVGGSTIVDASAGLTSRSPKPGEPALASGETDPHFWLDPELVKTYVEQHRGGVQQGRPRRGGHLRGQRRGLRRRGSTPSTPGSSEQVAQMPPADRKLVMDHASHGYFADRYGFTIVGTVIPSATTSESPTARQLSDLMQDHPRDGRQGDLRGRE